MTPLEQKGIVGTDVTPEQAASLSDEERWELLLRAVNVGLKEGRVLYLQGMEVACVDRNPMTGDLIHSVRLPPKPEGLAKVRKR